MTLKIAVVDLETTGPRYHQDDKIIQIAAVIIENGQVTHRHNMLINPEREIPENIQTLTGISSNKVHNAPTFESVASLWYERLKDCVFVAHHLDFDLKFLIHVFKTGGIDFQPTAIDSEILSQIFLPEAPGFNLFDLSQYLHIRYEKAHDALSDALTTANIMHVIAQKYMVLDPNFQEKIRQIIQSIEYNQAFFFQHPECFLIEDDIFYTSSKEHTDKNIYPMTPLHYLGSYPDISKLLPLTSGSYQGIFYVPYMSLEHPMLTLLNHLELQSTPLWLSLNSDQEVFHLKNYIQQCRDDSIKIVEYLSPKHFIHRSAFEIITQDIEQWALNHLEKIQLAAVQYWLTYTDQGLFIEINEQFHIHDWMEDRWKSLLVLVSHEYYQRMLREIGTADLVISTHFSTFQWMTSAISQNHNFERWHLLISDVEIFMEHYGIFYGHTLRVSEYFVCFHQLLDGLSDAYLRQQITHVLAEIDELLSEMEAYSKIKEASLTSSHQSYSRYLDNTSKISQSTLPTIIYELKSCLITCKHHEEYFSEAQMHKISQMLHELMPFEQATFDYSRHIRAKVVNKYPYRWEIVQKPLEISQENYLKLTSFKGLQAYFQSYCQNSLQMTWFSKVFLGNFDKIDLSEPQKVQRLTVNVPMVFTPVEGQEILDTMLDYVDDYQDQLTSHIVVIMPNVSACQEAFKIWQEALNRMGYSAFTKGMTGSSKKSFRLFIQEAKAVLFTVASSLDSLNFDAYPIAIDLFIKSLPFRSFDHPKVRSREAFYDRQGLKFSTTEDILIPFMVKDLLEILTYFKESTILNKAVIFDERLFTKAYSYRLRELLSNHLSLIIEEDYR